MLDKLRENLTSFDVYLSEVQNRSLEWSSPVHKSEKFWKETCFQIEGSEVLPMLKGNAFIFSLFINCLDILETETNPNLLCIACWDLGEFLRAHPQGKMYDLLTVFSLLRSILQQLKIHGALVKLLDYQDAAVKNHALVTLQKLMVTNWEHLTA
jgi:V-type H+-transporting ATPase subunit H